MTAIALLMTGNELMSGDTVDSNSSRVARALAPLGFSIGKKVTVGDDLALLVNEMRAAIACYPVLLVNGGLGPTLDDLTAEALAEVMAVDLQEHPEARAHVESWCQTRGFDANAANLKQSILPMGADVIANPVGSAVGFVAKVDGCHVICTPGVPSELKAMLADAVSTYLNSHFPQAEKSDVLRLKLFGVGESRLQQLLSDEFPDWPDNVEAGFRAGAPLLEFKLAAAGEAAKAQRDQLFKRLLSHLEEYLVGYDDQQLHEVVVHMLAERGLKLTVAESCTGGQIASAVTSVSGASAVFEAGFVTYSNTMKSALLGVPALVLEAHGAVSEEVVLAMAEGALVRAEADYAIAVSGIAGPSGGTEEKPVGTVWIAWGRSGRLRAASYCLPFGRKMFQTMVSALALDLLRRDMLGFEATPRYNEKGKG